MKKMITLGMRFFDEANGRYITPDSVGCDPHVFACVVEEITETGDAEITGRQLFTETELRHFKEV
jgi:hypothetical protein